MLESRGDYGRWWRLFCMLTVAATRRRPAHSTSTLPSSTRRSPSPAKISIWWRAGGTSSHCSRRRQGRQALRRDRMGLPGSFPALLCFLTVQFLSYLSRFTMPLSAAILLNIVLGASKPIA
uniref:Uncharacterized protein n=1 Tax=Aegilops tauschii subsp. strangulata TaxID=200361 RepID=A0A453K0Q4_AEGTS